MFDLEKQPDQEIQQPQEHEVDLSSFFDIEDSKKVLLEK